jgi:SAM-dependent methyltransferase
MTRASRVRAGWSRTKLPITPEMVVLDLGSGAFPNARADVLCDRDLVDNRHRAGLAVVIDRPLVRADATRLPFRDGAFDFVIASHLAEHIDDPAAFCRELARVATAGYVETPSPLADYLLDEEYHIWRVGRRDGGLVFRTKPPRSRLRAALTDQFYMVFYAGQPSCERPTHDLPDNAVGRALALALRAVGGVLNRVGVMHTRYLFTPQQPMRWDVRR